jgi:hypothetical protein
MVCTFFSTLSNGSIFFLAMTHQINRSCEYKVILPRPYKIIASNNNFEKYQIYRVDEKGTGVECGRMDVMVVKDGMTIAMKAGSFVEASDEVGDECLYYEFKDTEEERERGPYEVTSGDIDFIFSIRF